MYDRKLFKLLFKSIPSSFRFNMLTKQQYIIARQEKEAELKKAEKQVNYWFKARRQILKDIENLKKTPRIPEGWEYGYAEGYGYGLHPAGIVTKTEFESAVLKEIKSETESKWQNLYAQLEEELETVLRGENRE